MRKVVANPQQPGRWQQGLQWLLVSLLALLLSARVAALDVQAQGLLKDAAILLIDGKRQLLKVGMQSPEGVLLVSASAKMAVIEVDGKRQQLSLTQRISSQFSERVLAEIAIPRDLSNKYISFALLNGQRTRVLVDTGASSVALSSRQASALGIDYRQGEPILVQTASGIADAYSVKLSSVELGGITVRSVQASVVEGDYPAMVLLGMTFLQHVSMREQNGTLFLQAKH